MQNLLVVNKYPFSLVSMALKDMPVAKLPQFFCLSGCDSKVRQIVCSVYLLSDTSDGAARISKNT